MLSSEAAPLSALLASGYEVSESSKKKKEHKHRSSRKAHIQAELAPVSGNLSSDEEKKDKKSKKEQRNSDDLDEDEVMKFCTQFVGIFLYYSFRYCRRILEMSI
jgi:hypothetical protein